MEHTTEFSPISRRHYFRCHDCLMTVCIDLQNRRDDLMCGICNGRLEWMGQVQGQRYHHIVEVCDCNEICQQAQGPKCTCRCGGENHGKMKYHTYISAIGQIHVTPEGDTEKHLAIALEYRAAVDAAIDRIHSLPHYNDYCNRVWLDRAAWDKIHNAEYQLNAARKGKMQKSRIAKLSKVAA
jgi:hypothetical protein